MNISKKPGDHTPSKSKSTTAKEQPPVKTKKLAARKVQRGAPIEALPIQRDTQLGSYAHIFWELVEQTKQKTESDRMKEIRKGHSIKLSVGLRDAFKISFPTVAELLDTSTSTLERRMRGEQPLDLVASERLDRIAQITGMAEDVLESREEVSRWLTRTHPALGQQAPISLCDTEIGARQVRRILSAMEWGNVT